MDDSDLTLAEEGHNVVFGNSHDLDLPDEYQDLEFEQGNEHHLSTGYSNDYEMPLGCSDDHELVYGQTHEQGADDDHNQTPAVPQASTVSSSPSCNVIVGQKFPDFKSCRRALRDIAIASQFEMKTIKSDFTRFTAKCAAQGCPWRIHAAKMPGAPTFSIRNIKGPHTCDPIANLDHKNDLKQLVQSLVEKRLRENPDSTAKEIHDDIQHLHGISLSYKQTWRVKERVTAAIEESFKEEYRMLPQYCEQLRQTNPGSVASVYVYPTDNCFQRLIMSFWASIFGFLEGCRPLIGLDQIYMDSRFPGALLLASGFDGNGALFPLAFGIVDEESDENWTWFLSELHTLLEQNTVNTRKLTFLSNRQKGIVDGMKRYFPTASHGFCMWHLSESFSKEFNDSMLANLLWEAAAALTIIEFEAKLLEIELISQDAADWIREIPPCLWATAYFEGKRFGHLTTNIVEPLNSWLLEASKLPIIQMMECIRKELMTWFNQHRETSMQWTSILVPSAEACIAVALEHANNYQVLQVNYAKFEVVNSQLCLEDDIISNTVDIRKWHCCCQGWQLNGLPCAHAIAALLARQQNVRRFTKSYFTVANYKKTYSQTIHPIPDKSLLKEILGGHSNSCAANEVVIKPPKSLSSPAALRKTKRRCRAKDNGRVTRAEHCSRCHQAGHCRRSCAAS